MKMSSINYESVALKQQILTCRDYFGLATQQHVCRHAVIQKRTITAQFISCNTNVMPLHCTLLLYI